MRLINLIVAGLLLTPLNSAADQTDLRLQNLFAVLQQAEDLAIIRNTENQIWDIWLQHSNTDVEKLMQLGIERMNISNYSEALVIFNGIIENYPEYAEGWNKRATLYYVVGNYDASIEDIEKTLELEPRHFGALSGLGLVYIQRNELGKAKQAFENLVKVHPNSPNAKENLKTVTDNLRLNVI